VYRYLFSRKYKDVRVPQKRTGPGLAKSAQFLRTCRLVHNEGCSILYGENTFLFARHYDTRGPFWETVPKEIGYQDVLHFLKMVRALLIRTFRTRTNIVSSFSRLVLRTSNTCEMSSSNSTMLCPKTLLTCFPTRSVAILTTSI